MILEVKRGDDMGPSNSDIYAYQLLHFLVTKHRYQIVTIKQQRQDIWLMNAAAPQYPVIRLSAHSNADTLSNTDYLRNAHRAILDIIHRESKLFIINTNIDSSPIDNDFLTQVKILPNVLSDTSLVEIFPGIDQVVHEVEDNQKEYAKLTRSLEEMQMRQIKKQRRTSDVIKHMPRVTGITAIICIIYWLLTNMASIYLESDLLAGILCGGYYKMNIVALHEYWRLLTSGFMHVDILHLLMNLMALLNVGMVCEKIFKRWQYIVILLASIVVGNMFVFLTEGNLFACGISGGIFGLLGAFIASLFENGSIRHPMIKATVIRLLTLNILISLLPNISLFAHLGGFLCGVFLGIIFVPSKRWIALKKHVTICFTILVAFMAGYATRIHVVDPQDKALDISLLQSVRGLGIDWYADHMQNGYAKYYSEEDLK